MSTPNLPSVIPVPIYGSIQPRGSRLHTLVFISPHLRFKVRSIGPPPDLVNLCCIHVLPGYSGLMEYRGHPYKIIQGIEPNSFKWSVQLDGAVKNGVAFSRDEARAKVTKLIDRSLGSQNPKASRAG